MIAFNGVYVNMESIKYDLILLVLEILFCGVLLYLFLSLLWFATASVSPEIFPSGAGFLLVIIGFWHLRRRHQIFSPLAPKFSIFISNNLLSFRRQRQLSPCTPARSTASSNNLLFLRRQLQLFPPMPNPTTLNQHPSHFLTLQKIIVYNFFHHFSA